jgi:SAM-dependent methyltransferase
MIEMHESSLDNMRAFKQKYLQGMENEELLILDLGSLDVNGSYRAYFDIPPWTYRGIDTVSGKNVDIVLMNRYNWREIQSNSVDVLISGQAFEHIEFFWIVMLEVARILKPKGLCCIIAPSGGFEHRYPVDCWRFYPDGFAALARFARLEVLEVSTQWDDNPRYTSDDSNRWKDTVLVCRKTCLSGFASWRERVRRTLVHRISIVGLSKVSSNGESRNGR